MKNVSKIMQGFAIVLFATTAITNFGMSQEQLLIECNRKIDKIQALEASWAFKTAEFLSKQSISYLGVLGAIIGCTMCPGSILVSGVGLCAGCIYEFDIRELVEKEKKSKEIILVIREALMNTLKKQALKK